MTDGSGMSADYEEALMRTVDEIWAKWDKDDNGGLDRDEMRAFIEASLSSTSGEKKRLLNEEFDAIFQEFDIDGNGTIERDEMAILVKKLAQIWLNTPLLQ